MKLLGVWLSDEEMEIIRVRAFEHRKSKSEFARDILFPVTKTPEDDF